MARFEAMPLLGVLEDFAENAPVPLSCIGPGGVILWANQAELALIGVTREEYLGRHVAEFRVDREAVEDMLSRLSRGETLRDHPAQLRCKDGTIRQVIIDYNPLMQDGRLVYIRRVMRPPAEQLDQGALRTQLLVDSVRDYAIFMLDPRGHVATWNPGAQRLKGYRADEIIGRHFSTFYPPEDVAAGKCEMELKVAAAEGRFEDEGWRVRKDGTRFWANVVISAVRGAGDQLIGFGKVTRDLTERRRAEEERTARLAAEQANRSKDEFLAMLGHELRSPLAPIVTALQLARLRGVELRELDVIERQANHLTRLVDDLLDVSRVTRGKVAIKNERIELSEVVSQALELAGPALEQGRHLLTLHVPRRGCAVHGDRARLVQIVANIVNNAVKYSDAGSPIEISAAASEGRARLIVRDSGIGIEPAMLEQIFDSFVQRPHARDRSRGGLGLGLSIVRSLVHLHGGHVVARSDGPGHGAEFEIDLPLAVDASSSSSSEPSARPAPAARTERAQKILIVDDNQDAAALLAEILTTLGHQVQLATDGPTALAMAPELQPDVAVLDIGLPNMDGYELAQLLRAQPWAGNLRLVAVTGYGQERDRERSRAAGFSDHIIKPVDLATIERLIGPK